MIKIENVVKRILVHKYLAYAFYYSAKAEIVNGYTANAKAYMSIAKQHLADAKRFKIVYNDIKEKKV